jgi:sirohydrochlorin ferrochelatase
VDPELADIVDTMATEVCRRSGFDTSTTHLVLVAHGSAKSSASSAATVLQQQALEKREKFGKITSVFLNESPFLEEWIEDLQDDSPSTVLIGLFAAEGPHATEDVPNVLRQLEGRGDLLHKVQYAGVVGVQPEVVKLIQHSISRCALGAI